MNLGNIPGFYFDPQKKRYFKITDGARLPPSISSQAVYEHGRHKQYERTAKRAKTEKLLETKAQLQRVKRAGILDSSTISGTVLSRASGSRSSAYGDDAATAHVKQYKLITNPEFPFGFDILNFPTLIALPSPDTGDLLVAMEEHVRVMPWDQHDVANIPDLFTKAKAQLGLMIKLEGVALHARDHSWKIVSPMGHCRLREIILYQSDYDKITLGRPLETINLSIMNSDISTYGRIAMAFECGLYTLDDGGSWIKHGGNKEVCNARWLNERTIVSSRRQQIRIFDIRAQDSRRRFKAPLNVTGIQAVPDVDWQFVASTNRSIRLYDLRMTSAGRDRYTVEFPGVHEGTRSQFGVSEQRLIAAWQDDEVKVMSLKSGKFVARMEWPEKYKQRYTKPPSQIAWSADSHGSPYVYGCFKQYFIKWSANSSTNDTD